MKLIPIHADGRFTGENITMTDMEYADILTSCQKHGPVEIQQPSKMIRRLFSIVKDGETGDRVVCLDMHAAFDALRSAPRRSPLRVTPPEEERRTQDMKILDYLLASISLLIRYRQLAKSLRELAGNTNEVRVLDAQMQEAATRFKNLSAQINGEESIPLNMAHDSVMLTTPPDPEITKALGVFAAEQPSYTPPPVDSSFDETPPPPPPPPQQPVSESTLDTPPDGPPPAN